MDACQASRIAEGLRTRKREEVFLRKPSATVGWLSLFVLGFTSGGRVGSAKNRETVDWAGTWACSPQLAEAGSEPTGFADVTVRQVVHVSIGGPKIRVRFSNAFGKSALTISSAHVAKAAGGGRIEAGTDKPLTFNEASSVTIPSGALVYSDPLEFDLSPLSDLAEIGRA